MFIKKMQKKEAQKRQYFTKYIYYNLNCMSLLDYNETMVIMIAYKIHKKNQYQYFQDQFCQLSLNCLCAINECIRSCSIIKERL